MCLTLKPTSDISTRGGRGCAGGPGGGGGPSQPQLTVELTADYREQAEDGTLTTQTRKWRNHRLGALGYNEAV